jgi:hypothetical protein
MNRAVKVTAVTLLSSIEKKWSFEIPGKHKFKGLKKPGLP